MRTRTPSAAILVALFLALAIAAPVAARRISVPPSIELDGCVLPAPACPSPRGVVEMNLDDRTVSFAVNVLRFISNTTASTGKVLTEMTLRPLRVHGPKELQEKLVAGASLRVRATLRLADRFLLLQSIQPRSDRPTR